MAAWSKARAANCNTRSKGVAVDSAQLDKSFQHHHRKAAMMLTRSRISPNPADPHYGYRDLAHYVAQGFREPLDRTDLYLRLLACARAERLPLPSITHMQSLMAMMWDTNLIPPQHEGTFQHVCHHVSESICYDIGKFATDSMRAVASTLRVELEVQMGYEQDASPAPAMIQEPQKTDDQPPPPSFTVEGKPTIH